MKNKKIVAGILCGAVLCTACSAKEESTVNTDAEKKTTTSNQTTKLTGTLSLNETIVHQTMESFGASGAWWSQDVGGWTEITDDGEEKREYIAKLLFDQEEGIGLSAYRYNIGAGSTDGNSNIDDKWRQAESFLNENGEYDWSKDANAVWFLKKAVSYGVDDITFFVNSPLVSLTKNGKAHGDENASVKSNLAAENYEAFADYTLDVTEHFISEGIPVKYLSPINEPQWEWTSGQEGCHYEPAEVVAVLNTFVNKLPERTNLKELKLSAPESGEWGNTNFKYVEALSEDKTLNHYFDTWDIHSYWSDAAAKTGFANWMKTNKVDKTLKTSEWVEMKDGKDMSMSSALALSEQITEDLTILNVTSWQYWIAVSCYNYRDGLIYVSTYDKFISIPKRLWVMGNYSKFIRPGYVRVELSIDNETVQGVAFKGTNAKGKEQLVCVLTNQGIKEMEITLSEMKGYKKMSCYVTDNAHELEQTVEDGNITDLVKLTGQSVTTLVFE